MLNFILISFIILVILAIGSLLNIYFSAKKKTGLLHLKAKISHENRGLKFTKDNFYIFYKNGDHLILNEDDVYRDRDNYNFYKEDLDKGFSPTDLYSFFVLKNIRNYNK